MHPLWNQTHTHIQTKTMYPLHKMDIHIKLDHLLSYIGYKPTYPYKKIDLSLYSKCIYSFLP